MSENYSSLESMCELIVDCPHFTPEWTDSGFIVLKNQNIRNGSLDLSSPSYTNEIDFQKRIKRAAPQAGDIVFTREAPMGEVCLIPQGLQCCLGQRQVLLRPKQGVSNQYLFWALQSPFVQHQISWNEGTGTTVSNVRIPTLKALKIPRYWCNEEKIGTILGSIADKIALNTQTNQTLEQIAQAIFKSWFVDFDPVKAKMTALAAGGSREDAERAAMCAISGKDESALDAMQREQPAAYAELAATAALFPAAMQASELGDVPEGWGVSEIGQEVEVIGGSTPSTKNADFWERGNIHWTTPKDLSNLTDKILIDTDRKITDLGLKEISSGLLSVNTVLMSSRAPVGYLAINKIPLAINQGYIAMRCNGRLSPEYVLQWANSVMDEIKQRSSGTTFAEISKKNFRTISVIVPDAGVIELFSDKVSKLYDAITENLFQTKSLTELRDSLLPKLLSGEIDLSNLPDNINEANA